MKYIQDTKNVVIVGGNGALAQAFMTQINRFYPQAQISVLSRSDYIDTHIPIGLYTLSYADEAAIVAAVDNITRNRPIDMAIVTTGTLHAPSRMPEKSMKDIVAQNLLDVFKINTVVPTIAAKHLIPRLNRQTCSVFAALSARVGSISDNRLGGWYAYRASKAALNMMIKTVSIEAARRNPKALVVGLHPGTVDSGLSKPFQANVPDGKLFTAAYAAERLLSVLQGLTPEQTGRCFAWDGQEILP